MTGQEPAFPVKYQGDYDYSGITIRQYFIAMAMQGLLGSGNPEWQDARHTAENAVIYADALIEELDKK